MPSEEIVRQLQEQLETAKTRLDETNDYASKQDEVDKIIEAAREASAAAGGLQHRLWQFSEGASKSMPALVCGAVLCESRLHVLASLSVPKDRPFLPWLCQGVAVCASRFRSTSQCLRSSVVRATS